MLKFFEVARHVYHIGPTLNPRPCTYPIQLLFRRRSIGHVLRIDASIGSEFFHAIMQAPLSFDKRPDMRLRSVNEESDASRLRSLKSFCVTIVIFC